MCAFFVYNHAKPCIIVRGWLSRWQPRNNNETRRGALGELIMTTKTNKKTTARKTTKKTAPLAECGIARRLTNGSLFPVDASHTMVFASVADGRAVEFATFFDGVTASLATSGMSAATRECVQYFGAVDGGTVDPSIVRRNDVFNVLTAITGTRNPSASRALTRCDVPKIAGGRPNGTARITAQCMVAARAYIAHRDNTDAKRADALGTTATVQRDAALSLAEKSMVDMSPDARAAHVDGLIQSHVARLSA